MNGNKHEKSQMKLIALALIISLVIVIVAGFFIAKSIQNNNKFNNPAESKNVTTMKDESTPTGTTYSSVSDDTVIEHSDVDVNADKNNDYKYAAQYYDLTTKQLLTEFDGDYETLGQYEGGYFIFNSKKLPNLYFSVVADEGGKLVEDKIQSIVVTPKGYVEKGVRIGTTYEELRKIYGDRISVIKGTEESCMMAKVKGSSYSITFDFDLTTGLTSSATLKSNRFE